MSRGGKTQTQTQTQTNDPWAPAKPALERSLSMGMDLVARQPRQAWGGPMVAGLDDATMQGIAGIRQRASQPPAFAGQARGALGHAMSMVGADSQNPWGAAGVDAARRGTDTSALDAFRDGGANRWVDDLLETSRMPVTGAGVDALRGFLNADGGANPYLDRMAEAASRRVGDQVNAAFGAGGRSASGAHMDVLSRNLGDLNAQIYGSAYETDANRRLSAAGTLAGIDMASLDRRMQGLGTAAGLDEARIGRALSVADTLTGHRAADLDRLMGAYGQAGQFFSDDRAAGQRQQSLGLTAAGMLPMMREYEAAGDMDLLRIGDVLQDQRQREIDADIERFYRQQQAPYDDVGWLAGLASGIGGLGGTTNSTTTRPRQRSNPFLQGVGALTSVGGMLGGLGWRPFG